ncbi:MAG TPA: SDR family oxidoreductase [Mucilaginibacter sp.]|nr:SDR family oxidoreductase [Mucilaginibacter sp.]
MNIFISGASGGTGRPAVEQALKAGHKVTALVRDPAKLSITHPNLTIIRGDIMRPDTFKSFLQGQDAVISAIGVTGGSLFSDKPTTLYSQGNANLLAAIEQYGVKRFFCISASAIEISPVIPWYVRFVAKYVIQKLLKHMYADIRRMEAIVKESNTEWTIIRPPQLTDGPLTGQYRAAVNKYLKNCLKISRADLAHVMVSNLTNPVFSQAIVEVAY